MTVLDVVNTVLLVGGAVLLLPIATFSIECLAAAIPGRRRPLDRDGTRARAASDPTKAMPSLALRASVATGCQAVPRPSVAVLIPAHDEEAVIEPTLRAILPTLGANDRLLVVADNCTDETAAVAGRSGAEVIKRTERNRRGKGYALQCGIAALAADPPDVLVVIDADCLVEPTTIDILVRQVAAMQRPIQARNLTDRRPATGPVEAVSILANRFTNLIRPLGLARLGVPCRLTGTGMAFPWMLADSVQPAGDNIVEDLQLGIDLAMRGHMAVYCEEAGVASELPVANRAFAAQRTRWEQGHLRTALRQVPRLFLAGLARRSWPLLAMAADLSIPPLTLLVGLWLALAAASGLLWWLSGSPMPLALAVAGGGALAISLATGWAVFCRRQVPLRTLFAVPLYMLRKLPIYARMLIRRQHSWVRTERAIPTPMALERPLSRRDRARVRAGETARLPPADR